MKKFNRKSVISIIFLVFIFAIGSFFYVSSKKPTEQSWLKKNNTSINIKNNNDFSGFDILKDDLANYDVFLTGELHGVSINEDLDLKFLKFFKKQVGINYYLIEDSYCQSYFLNKYLETGNENFLNKTGRILTKEIYNKWKMLYEFNKQLPKEQRIKLVGLDIYERANIYSEFLNEIVVNKKIPKEVSNAINDFLDMHEKLKKDSYYSNIPQEKVISRLRKDIKLKQDVYEKYLLGDFQLFTYVLDNYYYSLEGNIMCAKSDKGLNYREEKIYENFKRLHEKLPKGKYYGHFGNFHIYQSGYNLGKFMNKEDSPVKNKVISIATLYQNSYTLSSMSGDSYLLPIDNKLIELIAPYKKSDAMLYKLIGKGSPFYKIKDCKYFQVSQTNKPKEFEENPLTQYFQYIIVAYDAKAQTPIVKLKSMN